MYIFRLSQIETDLLKENVVMSCNVNQLLHVHVYSNMNDYDDH